MTAPTLVVCPSCKGRRTTTSFVDGTDKNGKRFGGVATLTCRVCRGAGSITSEYAQRIAAGRRLRDDRLTGPAGHVSQREAAARFGLTHQEYSEIEQGRAEMPPAVAAYYATLPTNENEVPNG